MMAGQRDHEGRRRSGIWLPDECWDWLRANTAEGMTRDDLVEGLILLAMDKQQGRRRTVICPKCGGAEGAICFRCMGLRKITVPQVAADPAPTALVEALTAVDEARQRFYDAPDTEATVDASVPLARAKDALEAAVRAVVAADPAPTDPCTCDDVETGRGFEDCPVHDPDPEFLPPADPAPTDDDTRPSSVRLFGGQP